MRTARALIVWLLLPAAVVGALVLSAAATIDLATSQGVPDLIAPAAVLMLEVASLAGTLLWVLVGRRSLRRDAIGVTLAATGVALVAGVHAFGLFGAVGSLALVGTVHLASRAWRETWAEQPASDPVETSETSSKPTAANTAAEPTTVQELVDEQAVEIVSGIDEVREPEQPVEVTEQPTATVRQLRPASRACATSTGEQRANVSRECVAIDGPVPDWPEPPAAWQYGADVWAEACTAHYRGMGRPTVAREFGLRKPNHARQVSDAVKPFKEAAQVEAARA